MTSKLFDPSCRTTSKSLIGAPAVQQYTVRHSITNVRLGATPFTAVKVPSPLAASAVYRSSQKGKITGPPNVAFGRHPLVYEVEFVANCSVPLVLTVALLYAVP